MMGHFLKTRDACGVHLFSAPFRLFRFAALAASRHDGYEGGDREILYHCAMEGDQWDGLLAGAQGCIHNQS